MTLKNNLLFQYVAPIDIDAFKINRTVLTFSQVTAFNKTYLVFLKYIFAKIMQGVSTHGEFLKIYFSLYIPIDK